MLPRQHRRRSHHRHLPPRQRHRRRGAQGDLGLAEPDVAADEPIHGSARRQVRQHRLDGFGLISGFREGEPGGEPGVGALGRRNRIASRGLPAARDRDQGLGDGVDPPADVDPTLQPGLTVQTVEGHGRLVRAIPPQSSDILDGNEQLGAAMVLELQGVALDAVDDHGLQIAEHPDAVILVDNDVVDAQLGLGQEDRGLARPPFGDATSHHIRRRDHYDARRVIGETGVEICGQGDQRARRRPDRLGPRGHRLGRRA